MRLIAARPYRYDLKMYSTDAMNVGNSGIGYEAARDLILSSRELKDEEKKSMPRGTEMVVTTDGDGREGNMLVLVNPTEQRILVYRMNGNQIGLIAARHFEYDNYEDFYADGPPIGDGLEYVYVRQLVEKMFLARETAP